ncbi:(2Fe-2S)-binding protein [Nocardia sp. CDC160]|uniref:(2Fe-2S)-binding protein n=1 Tax=Nocardia sp. CDC160 TaxID=3112166 RepID=UPI002DBF9F6B|nr:(2Fe-2S)-binding protein [Nocardia sp. CDC160]MEC3918283.1 (2Fe-2S)-binding protein [Nocardia sp. CDC160]
MVAQPPVSQALVPGTELLRPQWLAERIADMGISWGTSNSRVSGTLWWCMAASSLVAPIVTAIAADHPAFNPALEHIALEIRPDGGVERVVPEPHAYSIALSPALLSTSSSLASMADHAAGLAADRAVGLEPAPSAQTAESAASAVNCAHPEPHSAACCTTTPIGQALRHTLSRVIPVVAEVSGAGVPSLWAIVADAIGNRALDIGAADAGARLARDVAGRLPVPRFQDIAGRTFVRRISCCLVFEVPGCDMCTSCPKRPAPEREALLAEVAARG